MPNANNIEIVRANEFLKIVSGALANLSAALFAAVAVRLYHEGFVLDLAVWTPGAIVLIWSSRKTLSLMQPEE